MRNPHFSMGQLCRLGQPCADSDGPRCWPCILGGMRTARARISRRCASGAGYEDRMSFTFKLQRRRSRHRDLRERTSTPERGGVSVAARGGARAAHRSSRGRGSGSGRAVRGTGRIARRSGWRPSRLRIPRTTVARSLRWARPRRDQNARRTRSWRLRAEWWVTSRASTSTINAR